MTEEDFQAISGISATIQSKPTLFSAAGAGEMVCRFSFGVTGDFSMLQEGSFAGKTAKMIVLKGMTTDMVIVNDNAVPIGVGDWKPTERQDVTIKDEVWTIHNINETDVSYSIDLRKNP